MLEYLGGLHLRALSLQVPRIPQWWWKQKLCRRLEIGQSQVARRKPFEEARPWTETIYYAVRAGTVYRHQRYERVGEPIEEDHIAIDLGDVVLAISAGDRSKPSVALLQDGRQFHISTNHRSCVPVDVPRPWREFELRA